MIKNKRNVILLTAVILVVLTAAFFAGGKKDRLPDFSSVPESMPSREETSAAEESTPAKSLPESSASTKESALPKSSDSIGTDTSSSTQEKKTEIPQRPEAVSEKESVPETVSIELVSVPEEMSSQPEQQQSENSREEQNRDPAAAVSEPQHQSEPSRQEKLKCTFTIICSTALNDDRLKEAVRSLQPKDGMVLSETEVTFSEGQSVFELLHQICRERNIPFEYSTIPLTGGAYIEGINHLYELDCGSLSGWMYSVNGEFPTVSCSDYYLKQGDKVQLLYTCDLGRDIGNYYQGE